MFTTISIQVLSQLQDLIKNLQPTQYAQRLAVFNGSSIGGHTRHIIEFYECLLNNLDSGIVNYDARLRDMQVEQNRDYALEIIRRNILKLEQNIDPTTPIFLIQKFGNSSEMKIPSNFCREEAYLIEHSIHHFALIRIGVQENFEKVEISKDFGVAFSTLDFRKATKEA
jgi:hypothetical protein